MIQEESQSRLGKIILMVAAALALLSVGYRFGRGIEDGPTAQAKSSNPSETLDSLAAKAQSNPTDAAGWEALGLAKFEAEDFAGAVPAFQKATELAPKDASLWAALGEAIARASQRDPLPPAALDAFKKATALDANNPRALYFLAVKRDLDGDHKGAIDDWLKQLKNAPAGAPWEQGLRQTIEEVGKINKIEVTSRIEAAMNGKSAPPAMAGIPGPSSQDIQAASALSPSEQRKMADGMVARLEAKLKASPANSEGWVMLIRSYMNLNQPEKASAALQAAIAANPSQADKLRQQADILGIK